MVKKTTIKILEKLKNWLKNRRHFIFSRYAKDDRKTQEPERSLIELPKEVREKLVNAVDNLPINPADNQAIASTLDETFTRWRENPSNTNNSVVILSSPVTPVSRILSSTLSEWAKEKQVSIKVLPFTSRPESIASIKSKLEHYIERRSSRNYAETEKSEVIVIPNLSWCFLRSLEGLEGIDYLRSLLCDGSKNRFWIIGSGQVCWEYLNLVYNLEAYCGKVKYLPAIAPEQLQTWLTPIIDELEITFDGARGFPSENISNHRVNEPHTDKQLLDGDGDKDNRQRYFERLADITQGVSIVAVQGFMQSIHHQSAKNDDETQAESNILIAQTPKLAKLPTLNSADHYLLYSLLLHEDLTLPALAESLGDEEMEVQVKVQVLRQQGVIEQGDCALKDTATHKASRRHRILKVNPIYYPQLKRELEVNNFFVNRD